MPASWTFDLVTAAGTPLTMGGLTLARQVGLQYQLNAATIFSAVMPLTSDVASVVAAGSSYIKGYRTNAAGTRSLKFYGPCWVDQIQGAAGIISVVARDPFAYLDKRFTVTSATGDAGLGLKNIIDTTNTTDGETGIRTNTSNITASSSVTVDYRTQNPSISSVAQSFAGLDGGCDFWTTPIELASGKICDFYASPQRGTVKNGAVFGFGEGTKGNCDDMGRVRNVDLVENDITGYSGSMTYHGTDTTSISTYRRLVSFVSYSGETQQALLTARTLGRLAARYNPDACAEYTAVPNVDAPALFDDFDIGDTVPLDFNLGLAFSVQQRVATAALAISDNGVERLASVAFQGLTA